MTIALPVTPIAMPLDCGARKMRQIPLQMQCGHYIRIIVSETIFVTQTTMKTRHTQVRGLRDLWEKRAFPTVGTLLDGPSVIFIGTARAS